MRIEPTFDFPEELASLNKERALVPLANPRLAPIRLPGLGGETGRGKVDHLSEISADYDVHYISPREMVDLSLDLYAIGFLTREQHHTLAFQSELMPNFDVTIGALTGERADPDRPRDYTAIWRARLAFETQYGADHPRIVERTAKILKLLQSLESAKKDDFG